MLPEARSIRWQPIRGGLVNIYRYDYEEFRYEQGRLLLRGNNGTGKSRVLALQLPFLLDGEISPHRLEPDGDPAKRMEWNLLLNKHPDRLGYTWIEFGRIDANGIAHFLTLGCGLHAVEGKGIHGRWFFVTSQRVGQDLFLATTTGQPLGKNRLEAELGEHGQIYTSAEAYREVVDRALFKLGDRYETLIELLIRLRQPKLSRTWDEKQLSDALSDALPPISSGVLADVAEAFGTLETDRRKLADYQTARDGVEAFLSEYRLYIQIAARRRAEGVRKTHSEYEGTQRRLRKAESEHDEASTELRTIEERIAKLRADAEGANEAVQTLASSPQMRDAEALDEARRLADDRRAEASRAEADWEVAKVRRLQSDAESAAASEAETTAWSNAEAVLQQSQAGAAAIGLELNHRDSIEKLDLPASASLKTIDTAEHAVRGFVRKRQDAVHHIRQANRAVEAAQLELHSAKGIYSQCETRLSEATENQRATQLQLQKEAESFLANYGTWLTNLRELQLQQADILAEKIADWCELGHGENPLVSTVREAARQAAEQIAQLQADARQRQTFVAQQLLELRDEYRQLESGFHRPPPAPYTRTADSRAGRPGAPLWALCDFSPDVEPTHRAGIEAALESAGLLDAWVTPDGRLLDTREHDTLLISGHSPLAPEKNHLAVALVPCIDATDKNASAVAEATVTSVLRHIGLGSEAGHVWVDRDGRWQAGPLHGSWSKPVAQHIGHAARETERRRRLTELSDAIDKAVAVERAILNELEVLDGRNATIAQEAATVPSDEAVRRLQAELVASTKSVAAARLQLTEAESRVEKCRNQLTEITSARDRDAADMKLSAWVEKLNEFEELLAQYREHVAKLWPMLRSYLAVRSQSHTAVERARAAQLDEEQRLHLLSQARERAAAATAKHSVLEATRGADVARVLAELELARAGVKQIQKQRDEADGERVRASERLGGAKQNIDLLREMLEQQAGRREQAVELLKAYVAARLLATVHADLEQIEHEPWTITRAVEIARTIEALLGHVESDDAAWDRSQKDIHQYIEELKDTLLRHDYSPVTTTKADGLFVVTVPFLGRDCTMLEFRNELSAEIGARQSVLDAREREVLENHLIGEVATHLHDLLHKAEAWVRGMNDELHSRPTSTGMKLRFTWQPIEDGPPGLHEARRRLLGAGETWSPAERAALGEFLQMRIKDVRASNQVGTWHEHLAEALDYRRWHQFGVDRQQDGTWKRLTRKTYGTGSSGEKAIALTIPQFAAAAAHYRSADALAPRLILLDEAFVAVDNDMRGKCLGLLHAFDLDFVMTSEREWGCYPTVPALAIYQLSTLPGIDAVGVTRWVWNGRERIRDCTALPGACDPGTADVGGNGKAHGNGEA